MTPSRMLCQPIYLLVRQALSIRSDKETFLNKKDTGVNLYSEKNYGRTRSAGLQLLLQLLNVLGEVVSLIDPPGTDFLI